MRVIGILTTTTVLAYTAWRVWRFRQAWRAAWAADRADWVRTQAHYDQQSGWDHLQ